VILLDTNVVSEPLKPRPEPAVMQWLNVQPPADLYLPAIVAAELYFGWSILPAGRRRGRRKDLIERAVEQFEGRIVPFDLKAAVEYGRLMAAARADGVGLPALDGQIAAIAFAHGATLATRNVRHFEATGLEIVNPWDQVP
jgi:predicted nucleic acid-binding protein